MTLLLVPVDLGHLLSYRFLMLSITIVLLLVSGQTPTDSGYISVYSSLPGISVWLGGDYIGRTPIASHAVKPGSYNLTIASNDSLDVLYARFRSGRLGQKLSSLWSLASIDAGTFQLDVKPGTNVEVFIDYGKVLAAPCRAKWLTGLGVGGFFLASVGIGMLIGHLAF